MQTKTRITNPVHTEPNRAPSWLGILTQIAFALALSLVVARCTVLETLRDPFEASPGSSSYPLGPGAATALVIDLLCCIPALLVLLRRALDKTYILRATWSLFLLFPLAIWMALSMRWADDQFATMVSVSNVVAALVLLWTAAQLVRSWLRLRIVAGICFGLLLVLNVAGFYYKFVELPDTQKTYEKDKATFLRQRGWKETDFLALQFEKKINSGEMIGFSNSSNSFAAIVVMLMLIGVGLAMQRIEDKDPGGWPVAILLSVPLCIWLLTYTLSKAATVTPALGAFLLAAVWAFRKQLARRSKSLFWLGVCAIVLSIAAVLGHGLYHHSLPTASLNFRWRYWVASWHMFLRHPIRGVGWENYGQHYLRDRLPVASEEIRDPHNFIIRFFVELGAIGGFLMLAWLIRLWWELTRPISPIPIATPATEKNKREPPRSTAGLYWIVAIAAAAMTINIFMSIDLNQDSNWLFIEFLKRALWLCALIGGAMLIVLRSVEKPQLDERPAPWILYGILVALGVFLIHNLIEFSLFEPGTMCLFGLLAGSALGMRHPTVAGQRRQANSVAWTGLGLSSAVLCAALIFFIVPTVRAESVARAGDEALRTGKFEQAEQDYLSAYNRLPLNADYAFRAGRALHYEGDAYLQAHHPEKIPPNWEEEVRSLYSIAASRNPSNVQVYLARASISQQYHDADQVIANFSKALELNPNEVSIRLQYANALEDLNRPDLEKEQLKLVLKYNRELDADDPKRLTQDDPKKPDDPAIAHAKKRLAELQGN